MFFGIHRFSFHILGFLLLIAVGFVGLAGAQPQSSPKFQTQEFSEADGIPVLMKHLPDYENIQAQATFAKDVGGLKTALGERPILDLIDFIPGTEAVTAPYDAGKLVIVEYASPQSSIEADEKFAAAVRDGDGTTVYRRIGNYNALVFDVTDSGAANVLLDQIKYEKQIQWLGDNPFRISAERAFVLTTTDIFMSTLYVIIIGIGISIVCGLIAGFIYFQTRERRRAALTTFTDAGGMTRLNLDGYTPEILPDKLLSE